jgi:DNA-binding NtrC family response regulator
MNAGGMNRISTFETGAAVDLIALSVFPIQENQNSLRHILRYSNWPLFHGSKWALKTTKSLVEALPILQNGGIPVVLCERDLRPGTWKDMVQALALLPDPPYLIVTSRHADDRLWAEALNLGAYDVLPTPFDSAELIRSLSVAWLRWSDRRRPALTKAANP